MYVLNSWADGCSTPSLELVFLSPFYFSLNSEESVFAISLQWHSSMVCEWQISVSI